MHFVKILDISSGLEYLHTMDVIHGNITSVSHSLAIMNVYVYL